MVPDRRPVLTVPTDEYTCTGFAFSPDGALLAVGKSNGLVGIWDLAGRAPVRHVVHDLCGGPVPAVAFSADGDLLATGGRDGHLKVRELRTGRLILRRPHPAPVVAVAFDPAATLIATACADGVVRVWSRAGRLDSQVAGGCTAATRVLGLAPDGTVTAADGTPGTSPDGRYLVTVSTTELAVLEAA